MIAQRGRVLFQNFRRHVFERPGQRARHFAAAQKTAGTKVGEQPGRARIVISAQDVFRLHIAVHHPAPVPEIERGRHRDLAYPGTCRDGLKGREARAWRLHTGRCAEKYADSGIGRPHDATVLAETVEADGVIRWHDRRLGAQSQDVAAAVGDFVLKRADGLWAYQLAVVVDDADFGITDIVRGEDLADNTPRQILLQRALGLPTPRYLHTPLVLAPDGEKLSKQNGAAPLDTDDPLRALNAAAATLGLPDASDPVPAALAFWTGAWRGRWRQPALAR